MPGAAAPQDDKTAVLQRRHDRAALLAGRVDVHGEIRAGAGRAVGVVDLHADIGRVALPLAVPGDDEAAVGERGHHRMVLDVAAAERCKGVRLQRSLGIVDAHAHGAVGLPLLGGAIVDDDEAASGERGDRERAGRNVDADVGGIGAQGSILFEDPERQRRLRAVADAPGGDEAAIGQRREQGLRLDAGRVGIRRQVEGAARRAVGIEQPEGDTVVIGGGRATPGDRKAAIGERGHPGGQLVASGVGDHREFDRRAQAAVGIEHPHRHVGRTVGRTAAPDEHEAAIGQRDDIRLIRPHCRVVVQRQQISTDDPHAEDPPFPNPRFEFCNTQLGGLQLQVTRTRLCRTRFLFQNEQKRSSIRKN